MFLGCLACNKLLRRYLFLMTLIILRSTAQLFCMILEFVWCFSHHSGFEGRNTTEVKSRFHPITLRVHAASMIYCCCWPWPAGWSRFIISFLNCEVTLFFSPSTCGPVTVPAYTSGVSMRCSWGQSRRHEHLPSFDVILPQPQGVLVPVRCREQALASRGSLHLWVPFWCAVSALSHTLDSGTLRLLSAPWARAILVSLSGTNALHLENWLVCLFVFLIRKIFKIHHVPDVLGTQCIWLVKAPALWVLTSIWAETDCCHTQNTLMFTIYNVRGLCTPWRRQVMISTGVGGYSFFSLFI